MCKNNTSATTWIFSCQFLPAFFNLVDTLKHKEEFKRHYQIPSNVSIEHCNLGEWHEKSSTEAVAIPMIAFIEGWIRIPMGRVTRDFLSLYRLCPTQCVPNIFRILDSVNTINDKMGINLTHNDINWVYNCQKNNEARYYLKTRVPTVRLISCLPETNKGMDEDFLIVSREWHDGLHCPVKDGILGGVD